jgi:hypothetical protein
MSCGRRHRTSGLPGPMVKALEPDLTAELRGARVAGAQIPTLMPISMVHTGALLQRLPRVKG